LLSLVGERLSLGHHRVIYKTIHRASPEKMEIGLQLEATSLADPILPVPTLETPKFVPDPPSKDDLGKRIPSNTSLAEPDNFQQAGSKVDALSHAKAITMLGGAFPQISNNKIRGFFFKNPGV
jgi:hypothetical protein